MKIVWWTNPHSKNALSEQMHYVIQTLIWEILHAMILTKPKVKQHLLIATTLIKTLVCCPGSWIFHHTSISHQQALACSSEYHSYHSSHMPNQDARSNDYAHGTTSSEERQHPTKLWVGADSFSTTDCVNIDVNINAMLHEEETNQ